MALRILDILTFEKSDAIIQIILDLWNYCLEVSQQPVEILEGSQHL